MEVGEPETHGDFAAFRAAVLARSRVDSTRLAEGEAHLRAADGTQVGLRLSPDGTPPIVFRDGALHAWPTHTALWAGAGSPVTLGWKQGLLKVQAGGYTFEGKFVDGRYTFVNTEP